MRAPDWWGPSGGAAVYALAPAGWAWGLAGRLRQALGRPWRAPVKVVSVGNIVVGGAGKTPVALELASRLARTGARVGFLACGYGGGAAGPLRVDPDRHDARAVGDEALLLAARAPTWIARDRRAGARAAVAGGSQVLVLDDGHQDPALVKDLALVVVDGGFGFGNGRPIPAGPLRESPRAGLARAHAAVVVGADEAGVTSRIARAAPGLPVLRARLVPAPGAERLEDRAVVAFAGIGRPEKFFATLAEIGCRVVAAHRFPDHHTYRANEIQRLKDEARASGALAVTTAKDRVRLAPEERRGIEVVHVALAWADEAAIDALLAQVVARP